MLTIKNVDYYDSTNYDEFTKLMQDIHSSNDKQELAIALKSLRADLKNPETKNISTATLMIIEISNQLKKLGVNPLDATMVLEGESITGKSEGYSKQLTHLPNGKSPRSHSILGDKSGVVIKSLLIVGIAATLVMYTLLLLPRIVK